MSSTSVVRAADNLRLGSVAPKANKIAGWLILVGALLTALFAFWHHERFWSAYLVGFVYLLSISLGGVFFVAIQHTTRAGWSVVVRRVAEAIAYNMRFLWILFLPLLIAIGMGYLQPESAIGAGGDHAAAVSHDGDSAGDPPAAGGDHGEDASHDEGHASEWITGPHLENAAHPPLQAAKQTWLSFSWFSVRCLIYFLVWILISHFYYSTSVKQDATRDPALTNKMQWWGPLSVVLFAVTTAMAAFDLLMSMDPHWFSTMFGVYFFAGCFVSFCATLNLTLYLLQRNGLITESVTAEHYHDVGKFMFAFIVFWAYVAFSQYMLIWYANMPEETGWFLVRQTGDWAMVGGFLVLGHFVLPFFMLMSRFVKRRPGILALLSVYVLFVHYVDLFWIVQPQKSPYGHMPVPLLDAFLLFAFIGAFIAFTVRGLKSVNLIPIGDPRLGESLAHENY
jgi:hypothetical protein